MKHFLLGLAALALILAPACTSADCGADCTDACCTAKEACGDDCTSDCCAEKEMAQCCKDAAALGKECEKCADK
mgnify:CR=1 FL=1